MRPLLALAFAVAPVAALAQQPPATAPAPPPAAQPASSTCDVQIDSSRHSQFHLDGGYYDTFAWAGVWAHCRDQPTTMYSDSVAWYPGRDLLYLVGHVRFQDSITALDADQVTYYLHQERLYAEGHVYTRNLRTGSDLRGKNLDYYRVAPPLRDTLELYAQQRPTIRFYPSRQPDRADTEPFVVVADRTHMRGSDEMWGGGNVTIDRSDLAARGDSAWLDLGHDAAWLLGHPEVSGVGPDAYHLLGDRLHFGLTPQHEIRSVLASGQAVAYGADWRLDADTLDLTLDSSKVQRAQAWGHHRRPDAVSGTHTIVADSLDIHMPDQLVRLVWAWGDARMVTRDTSVHPAVARDTAAPAAAAPRRMTATLDSLLRAKGAHPTSAPAAPATQGAAAVPAAGPRRDSSAAGRDTTARRAAAGDTAATKPTASDSMTRGAVAGGEDWLLGDSLRADFLVRRDSTTGKPKSELHHLTSYADARALYHVESSDTVKSCGRRGINYSRGARIDIAMDSSHAKTVDVVGQADGMYLEPDPCPADTTKRADSTARADSVKRADTTGAADTSRSRPAPRGRPAPDSLPPRPGPAAAERPKP